MNGSFGSAFLSLRRKLLLARLAMAWERLWPALTAPLAVLTLFVVAAYFELFTGFAAWLHIAVLAVWALVLVGVTWRSLRRLAWPTREEAQRRLETDSKVEHRPLTTVEDRLAAGAADPTTAALWRLHQERMAERLRLLKNGVPHPGVVARDGMALRIVPLLLLLVAIVGAGGWRPDLLAAAFTPSFAPPPPVGFEVWVNPPKYTHLPPRLVDPKQTARLVRVPVGSTISAIVQGGNRVPSLSLGDKKVEFTSVDKEKFTVTTTLAKEDGKPTRIAIDRRGSELIGWPMVVVDDNPPTVEFAKDPEVTQRSVIRFDYLAADDYGLVTISSEIHRAPIAGDSNDAPDMDDKIAIDLPLSASSAKKIEETFYKDLTAHPWAGLPVYINLIATDGAGQQARSEKVTMTLPERNFRNPVAAALIIMRKALTRDPKQRAQVAEALARLDAQPELYGNDPVVHLAMRTAANRLLLDLTQNGISEVQKLLWDTALRLEEGGLSMAERELRRAQDALQQALDRNAPDEEIQKLMNDVQQAMNNYMRELAEKMRQNGQEMTDNADPDKIITSQDLQRMLDEAREMAQSGNRDAAKQKLSQLRNMLENMRPLSQNQAKRNQQRNQQGQQMMKDLDNIIRQQHNLMGETERQRRDGQDGQQQNQQQGQKGQKGQKGQPGQQGNDRGRGQQEQLRHQLGDLMGKFGDLTGEVPDSLGAGEQAMRDAENALGRGDLDSAERAQRQALDALQQGMEQFAQQMRGNGNNVDQQPFAQDPNRDRRDPLGREGNFGNAVDDKGVKIPDQPERQLSREILEELRRRSGDADRPKLELDYLDRLLRSF